MQRFRINRQRKKKAAMKQAEPDVIHSATILVLHTPPAHGTMNPSPGHDAALGLKVCQDASGLITLVCFSI